MRRRGRPPLPPHVLRALQEAAPKEVPGEPPPAPVNPGTKPTKFRSKVATDHEGVVYESRLERATSWELELMRQRGEIARWTWGPRFLLQQDPLKPNTMITYRPDFLVWPSSGGPWFALDAKGMRTAAFNLKVRLWKLRYPAHPLWLVKKDQPWKLA